MSPPDRNSSPPDTPTVALCIEDLCFKYPGSQTSAVTLDALDLPGDGRMLVTGPSGCGKSTLLQLIAGLLDPDAGRILVAGTDIHRLRGSRRDAFRGGSIGMVFQTFALLDGFTALENALLGMTYARIPKRDHQRRAHDLLATLGVQRAESPVDNLSVGQRQRVAIARALAPAPALVLADEPTASLDPANADNAIDLLIDSCASAGAALLCVSHDPRLERHFERTLRL